MVQATAEFKAFKTEITYYGKRAALLTLLGVVSLLANLDTNQIALALQWVARLAAKIAGLR